MDTGYVSFHDLSGLVRSFEAPSGTDPAAADSFLSALETVTGGPRLRILDAGCGKASVRLPLQKRDHDYVGVDVAGGAADVIASVDALPFPDSSFDFVICRSVLQFLNCSRHGLLEIRRVMVAGGHLIGSVPFLEPWAWGGRIHFTPGGIALHLREAGFQVHNLWAGWPAESALIAARRQLGLQPSPPRAEHAPALEP